MAATTISFAFPQAAAGGGEGPTIDELLRFREATHQQRMAFMQLTADPADPADPDPADPAPAADEGFLTFIKGAIFVVNEGDRVYEYDDETEEIGGYVGRLVSLPYAPGAHTRRGAAIAATIPEEGVFTQGDLVLRWALATWKAGAAADDKEYIVALMILHDWVGGRWRP